jgi:regulatory protein RepA
MALQRDRLRPAADSPNHPDYEEPPIQSRRLDLSAVFTQAPPPIDFVLPGLIAGTVGVLAAPAGTGKSYAALQICASVAAGADLAGLGSPTPGEVAYLPAEDPEIVVQHRLFYGLAPQLTPEQRAAVELNLAVEPLMDETPDLMERRWLDFLEEACTGRRLAVLDTLSMFHTLKEQDNSDMSRFIGRVKRAAARTGCAVVLVHHTNKNSETDGTGDLASAVRGATAIVANSRWVANMRLATEAEKDAAAVEGDLVRLGVSKGNYGKRIEPVLYERQPSGFLKSVSPITAAAVLDDFAVAKAKGAHGKGGSRVEV